MQIFVRPKKFGGENCIQAFLPACTCLIVHDQKSCVFAFPNWQFSIWSSSKYPNVASVGGRSKIQKLFVLVLQYFPPSFVFPSFWESEDPVTIFPTEERKKKKPSVSFNCFAWKKGFFFLLLRSVVPVLWKKREKSVKLFLRDKNTNAKISDRYVNCNWCLENQEIFSCIWSLSEVSNFKMDWYRIISSHF